MRETAPVPRRLAILGSTGSIGRNALKVVAGFPGRFRVAGLAAGGDWRTLAEQAAAFRPSLVAMADRAAAARLRSLGLPGVRVLEGEEGVAELVTACRPDLVLSAISGSAGLVPTWRAVSAGLDVALANKEPLVMAGGLITREARRRGSALIPVDSEHHAVFTALRRLRRRDVAAVTLTASGGPFLGFGRRELERVTVRQALRHPRWSMGRKISIDSATLMNKGLEVIEAHWLFGLPEERIRVVVHPESLVHGMVHLADGGLLAYLSVADMRLPIAAALNHPELLPLDDLPVLDLEAAGRLTFLGPDHSRFPGVMMAREALRAGGTAPTVLNAANEAAVAAFLRGRIHFTDIFEVVRRVTETEGPSAAGSLEEVLEAHARALRVAGALIRGGTPARRGGSNKRVPRGRSAGARPGRGTVKGRGGR